MVTVHGFFVWTAISLVVGSILWFLNAIRFFTAKIKIPGPMPIPIIGNCLIGLAARFDMIEFLKIIRGYGDISRFWMGPYSCVLVEAPEYLQILFNDPALVNRPPHAHVINHLLGEGNAVASSGHEWKVGRGAMQHGINSMPQATLLAIVQQGAEDILARISKEADKGFFKFLPISKRYNFGLITRLSLAEDLKDPEFLHSCGDYFEEALDIVMMRIFSPLHYFDTTFFLTKESKLYSELRDKSRNSAIRVLEEAKKERDEILASGGTQPNRYVHNLMQTYGHESLEFFITHIVTMYAAGVDTSANSATFLLMLLGMHPEIQQRVYEEDKRIQEELNGREMELADLRRYEYLSMCVKETLRLMPIIPIVARHAATDLQFGKYVIPKSTIVFANLLFIMRNEKYFPDPLKFDPERFHPDNADKIIPYTYLPLGHGRRSCLGNKLAPMSIKCTVMLVVRNYKIYSEYKTPEELNNNVVGSVTLKDRNEGRIRLERRN